MIRSGYDHPVKRLVLKYPIGALADQACDDLSLLADFLRFFVRCPPAGHLRNMGLVQQTRLKQIPEADLLALQ